MLYIDFFNLKPSGRIAPGFHTYSLDFKVGAETGS